MTRRRRLMRRLFLLEIGMQIPLPHVVPDDDTLSGLTVRLERACGRCGHSLLVTGAGRGTHKASLHCARCRRHNGWLSHEAAAFLSEVIAHFGRPTAPIDVRKGGTA